MDIRNEAQFILHKINTIDPEVFWKNRIQKSIWKTFSAALTTVLTLTMDMLMYDSFQTPSHTMTLMNAASVLSSITQTILSMNTINATTIATVHSSSNPNHTFTPIDDQSFKKSQSLLIHLIQTNLNMVFHFIFIIKESALNNDLQTTFLSLIFHTHQLLDSIILFCSPFDNQQWLESIFILMNRTKRGKAQ
ncbi:hypothetical protein BJ944DRAFT_244849 [Cunninghamella echinulata]|nr:hypothetical protein BJ944DRAFT_244849 [Cunninghamella echinulata]